MLLKAGIDTEVSGTGLDHIYDKDHRKQMGSLIEEVRMEQARCIQSAKSPVLMNETGRPARV